MRRLLIGLVVALLAVAVAEAGARGDATAAASFSSDFYGRFARQIGAGPVHMASLLSAVRRRFYETGDPTYLAYTFYSDVNLRFAMK